MKVSYFVSPHGFGHAARSAAVMAAMLKLAPDTQFQVFTTVPENFFRISGVGNFSYQYCCCDVGLVQLGPTSEDLPATVEKLTKFLRFETVDEISLQLKEFGPDIIVCDISPLGLHLGAKLGIRTVLVENFTWNWIYQGYLTAESGLASAVSQLTEVFNATVERIQAAPVSMALDSALSVSPISRALREQWVRPSLIGANERYVLVSMGGIAGEYPFIEQLSKHSDFVFVIAGTESSRSGNLVRFASDDDRFYHPNLVNDASLVVSKAGYSTVAEVYAAGVPFVVLNRPQFRESAVMIDFIKTQNCAHEISQAEFDSGAWLSMIGALAKDANKIGHPRENGAHQAAKYLLKLT